MHIDIYRKLSSWRLHRHDKERALENYGSELKATVTISKEGFFEVTVEGLSKAIDNQPARLRLCLVCGHVLWAQRSDKKTCSDKCAAINRQRRARANKKKSKDEYKKASIKKAETQTSKRK